MSQGQNGSEDRFFFREKVLLSEIVGKKDRVEQLSNRAEGRQRSEVRQRNEVLLTGDRGKGNFLKEKKKGLIVRFLSQGKHTFIAGGQIFSLIWRLFNHKSTTKVLYKLHYFGLLFLLPFLEY